jgi:hypothetical protein
VFVVLGYHNLFMISQLVRLWSGEHDPEEKTVDESLVPLISLATYRSRSQAMAVLNHGILRCPVTMVAMLRSVPRQLLTKWGGKCDRPVVRTLNDDKKRNADERKLNSLWNRRVLAVRSCPWPDPSAFTNVLKRCVSGINAALARRYGRRCPMTGSQRRTSH